MRLRSRMAQPRWRIQARELEVLRAVRDGLVDRDPQYRDLAPWMLGTRQVSSSITLLVLHGLVRLGACGFGPPQITARGLRMPDGWAGSPAFGDHR
ncbi:MAG TPA: hypothetical protein VI030_07695 [Propionibacteriaceae bacterium]